VVLKGQRNKESSVAVDYGRMVKGLFSDRFYCENGLLSVLKGKGKGDLYGGTERNCHIQKGPNFVSVL